MESIVSGYVHVKPRLFTFFHQRKASPSSFIGEFTTLNRLYTTKTKVNNTANQDSAGFYSVNQKDYISEKTSSIPMSR